MNEVDDMQLKEEIDTIMERVDRIMQGVDGLNADPKETAPPAEE